MDLASSPKAVEGHRAPKAPPFESQANTLLECALSSAAFFSLHFKLITSKSTIKSK
jgi:hypothetical protein